MCGECDGIPLYFKCCSVNRSVCLVGLTVLAVLFGETICNMFGVWLLFCC